MLEILGSIAASEAGKFVLEKGLELGQSAAEDYVKDFFKDALKGELRLKGNLITAERLTQVLTGYLREQGFEALREKANGLIEQLRSRNWILCDRGADTYGFVHRIFLEAYNL